MVMTGYGEGRVKPNEWCEGINKIFVEWEAFKHTDIMGYRNYAH